MNKKGVILSVILTALLGFAAWWMSRPSRTTAPTGPVAILPGVDPAGVTGIQVISAPDRVDSVRAGKLPNLWLITRESTSVTEKAMSWPADANVVRAAGRVLAEAQGEPADASAATNWAASFPRVRVDAPSKRVQLEFGSELAGRVTVRVGEGEPNVARVFMAPATLAAMFKPDSMKAWRSKRLMPVESSPARVRIEAAGEVCQLSRAGGSWGIVEPALGRGDDPSIAELLTRIAGLEVVRFADDTADQSESGLTSRSPRILMEADRRAVTGEQVQRQTIVQEIRIGGRADVGGKTVFVQMSGKIMDADGGSEIESWGPLLGVADAAGLSSIATSPTAYVNRRAMNVPAADVTRLEVSSVISADTPGLNPTTVIERGSEAWTWSMNSGAAERVPPDDAKMLDAVLKLLCDERSAEVAPPAASKATEAATSVRVNIAAGVVAKQLLLTAIPEEAGSPGALIIDDGTVERRYPLKPWASVMNWLRARLNVPR